MSEYIEKIENNGVSVYGLGYVGLTLAIVLAEHGYFVRGLDVDSNKISMLKRNLSYLHEKNIVSRLKNIREKKLISFHSELQNDKNKYIIICIGTPINYRTKKPIIKSIQKSLNPILNNLKENQTLILRSTVPIGFTKKYIVDQIHKKTSLKVGKNIFVCFAPERTIEGKALEELKSNPQIIGGYSEKCIQNGIFFFQRINHKIITVGNLESAETAKLIDNSYRDTTFAFSNEIARICEKYNLNALNIIDACNSDYKRNNIPKPSPGVGGACLSKDPHILVDSASKKGFNSLVVKSSRSLNESMISNISKKIIVLLNKVNNPKIIICGLAFKGNPETGDLRNSTSIEIINKIIKLNNKVNIFAYDPVLKKNEITKLGYKYCKPNFNSIKADAIIFANNHNSFLNLDIIKIIDNLSDKKILCDCWGLFSKVDLPLEKIKYFGVGF